MNRPEITNSAIREALQAIRDMADEAVILELLYKIYRKGVADGKQSQIDHPHKEDMGR